MKDREDRMGTSLPDFIDVHLENMEEAVELCLPFADIRDDINNGMIVTVKENCEKILEFIRGCEKIHNITFENKD